VTALRRTDLDDAQALVTEIARELESHWRGEEGGLFAEMHGDDTYREYIDDLVKEHRELQELLTSADLARADDRLEVAKALDRRVAGCARRPPGRCAGSCVRLALRNQGGSRRWSSRHWQRQRRPQGTQRDDGRPGGPAPGKPAAEP